MIVATMPTKIGETSVKYCSYKMKRDIGMAHYEKQGKQEAAHPIPISLYNLYKTVRHEKQRYRDGVRSLLFPLFS